MTHAGCGGTIIHRRWREVDIDGRTCEVYDDHVCGTCLAEVDDDGLSDGQAECARCGEAGGRETMRVTVDGVTCDDCMTDGEREDD